MRWRRWSAAFGFALSFCSMPQSARADVAARLLYVRGPGAELCPGEDALRAAVSARLGYDPFFGWAKPVVLVEVARASQRFSVSVKLIDADNIQRGARRLIVRGNDCSAVIDALGLTVSLTLDPAGNEHKAEATEPAAPARSEPEAPEQAPAADPVAVIASSSPVREAWSFRAGAGGTLPLTPNFAIGPAASVFLGARYRGWSLDLEARFEPPAVIDSDRPPLRVSTWLLAAALVPCGHWGIGFGCPVLSAGTLGATAVNVSDPISRRGPWSAAGARAGAEWQLGSRVSFIAHAEALATLTRDTFWVDGARIYSVPAWTADLGIAGALRFQ